MPRGGTSFKSGPDNLSVGSLCSSRLVPSKSQKPITQFFKNPTALSSKNVSCNSEQINFNKRKASSSDDTESSTSCDVDIESDMFDLTPTAFCSDSLKSNEFPNEKQSSDNNEVKESEPLKEIYSPNGNILANMDKRSPSSKKSPIVTELRRSPRIAAQKLTPQKKTNIDSSDCPKRAKIALNFGPDDFGDIVSIIATKSSENVYCVNNSTGLLVIRPDYLISSTSVVSGVFCRRKAVLQERFKGLDSSNTAMTIGILVHELVQKALTQKIHSVSKLQVEAELLVKDSISMLYDAGLSMDEVNTSMNMYIPPLSSFVKQYILDRSSSDIVRKQKNIIPLELKSGKASGSVEHRGQLILYSMMLALQRNANPDHDPDQSGLLLYLRQSFYRDKIDLHEVKSGYPERRDLIMLRNELVQYLAPGPKSTDCDNDMDIEEAAHLLRQQFPEPIHHQTACGKCPYLTLCSLHLWHTEGPRISESHPLNKLREAALGHLLNTHVSYFLHWTALCKLEEQSQATHAPLHALWTDNPEKRAQRGICIPNLQIESVIENGDRFVHVFKRDDTVISDNNKDNSKGPQEGEFAIVSTNDRPWIASGTILLIDSTVHILLERLIIDMEMPEFEKKMPREIGRLGSKLMKGLNIEQQRAVLRAIAAKDYALLQGLPGTGKTQTISVLIQMLMALKQCVLVTAHTHSAVDNVLSRLPTTLKILRLGTSSRVAPAIQPFCEHKLAESCTTPEELAKLYESMEVVGVTCLGASHALLTKTKFDICIVDEATQVLQCTVLRPLFAARRFVLVGDPAQLPPVVRSNTARRLGMETSLFARLSAVKPEAQSTLCLQYRMNSAITDIANAVAYDGRLRCANDDIRNATMTLSYEGGMALTHVGVIAPFREQVTLLRKSVLCLFKNVTPPEVSTVDQFQGRDKSVIIFSCTKNFIDENREGKIKEGEILNDPRRLAVSVTRAKHKFITIGNVSVLGRYEPFQKLITACSPITLPVDWPEGLPKEFDHLL
ncbi:hypothetical protein EVAR_89420_1 [Eumeta japonica]|uniref:DNA replication ATP-dependent helicase/nuclease n=1 Tax=Eumeta variegata TaxID=151549 RepID=A0A4C1XUP2_EUMVA|nr:hypothetical protein EVAR_89420_1 [Eumeta japonica]